MLNADELRDALIRARKAAQLDNAGAVLAIIDLAISRDSQLQIYVGGVTCAQTRRGFHTTKKWRGRRKAS